MLQTYGVVPQALFPESLHSSLSGPVNALLKTKLREHALVLRALSSSLREQSSMSDAAILSTLRAKKEELMKEVYTVMSATLGVPPSSKEKFTWDFYDKDGKPGHWTGTPKEFYYTVASGQYKVRVTHMDIDYKCIDIIVAIRFLFVDQRPKERVRQVVHGRQAW